MAAFHSMRAAFFARLAPQRGLRRASGQSSAWVALLLVGLGPLLVVATFSVVGPFAGESQTGEALRFVLLLDMVYILVVAALVMARVARMISARRARSAGSRLHLRLTVVFSVIALVPTILVAVFATVTISMGLEGWFSQRVSNALGNSVAAARAYAQEHRDDLVEDARGLAGYLNVAKQASFFLDDGDLRQLLSQGQELVQRGLSEAYVIDGAGQIRARGESSYLFDFDPPAPAELLAARDGDPILIEDWSLNEFRVLLKLPTFADRYLYITRDVDGQILSLLDETEATVQLYRQLEADRGRMLFEFGLLYLGFALILILGAVWLGLWFAERLARPVGRLAGAAQRVGKGDLAVRVPEEKGEDEIAMLGRLFNQMTAQLKNQRDALVQSNAVSEKQRRLFDSVLSSISSGVIGLNQEGRVDFINAAAERLLEAQNGETIGLELGAIVPEFAESFAQLQQTAKAQIQQEIAVMRKGHRETLLVQISRRRSMQGGLEGFVVAFDDVTALVSAQRMAAWGDVARRIAHEIKNPLTPIQLSSERVKRKFAPMLEAEEATALRDYADVIIRQTNDLRRIVDEFSKFARMPEPERRMGDLRQLVYVLVSQHASAFEGIAVTQDLPDGPLAFDFDATMMSQAVSNLLKNACEAMEDHMQDHGAGEPCLHVTLHASEDSVHLRISDSGPGWPEDRMRLFEPYVTTRSKGTGLGLPIVKKIIEDHGGSLTLVDAPPLGANTHSGAAVEIVLPLRKAAQSYSKFHPETERS